MAHDLSDRQKFILTLIVHEHTRTAQAIASKNLVELFDLHLSSATVRNEMAALTEMGYLRQPYTSGGRIPTEEGYRYFVSNLVKHTALPDTTQRTISHQFYQSRQDMEQWLKLAASVLARQSQAASLVTAPHSINAQFKHLELISTHGRQVLMVLVLVGGEIRQQLLTLPEPVTQEQLSRIANQLTDLCQNCDAEQLAQLEAQLDALGRDILDVVKSELTFNQQRLTGELYLDGMTNVLAEPEFAESEDARHALKVLEERAVLEDVISKTSLNTNFGSVQVLIGGEGTWQELSQCSMILARYGSPGYLTGILGVLGPMRMSYGHTISTVRFVANLLSDLVTDSLVD